MKKTLILLIFSILFSNPLIANTKFFEEGLNLYKNKKFDEAKFKFEQDIVFNPKSEKAYLYLSKIYNEQDNKEFEEKNLNTVILLNPKNEEATFNLAQLKFKKSDYEGSKKLIDQLQLFCKSYCQKSQKLKVELEKSLKK